MRWIEAFLDLFIYLFLFHILQARYANLSAKLGSSEFVIPVHRSLKSTKRVASWFLREGSSHHTSFSAWQPQRVWNTSSISALHLSHVAHHVTFLLNKFLLVGSDSQQALQMKCLILFGTPRDQIPLQQEFCAEGLDGPKVVDSRLLDNIL